ncbi:Gfo/Idh/MocA family oxidoreductase [Desertivirga xinjiangensis]|uniref:Gfo/Idh/MocA family oxidoreductase n=1 Tax=Desertivirga xinjiangensis TaxID=539206 RepID=UPI00210ED417|nr:Gfo/Idh/MocA family oxidoreductase [Pedobacter xinjiangensis]
MEKQIVTGLLSYGMSGRVFHAPFIQTHPSFQLYAATERTRKKINERYPEVISYSSVEELINDPKIELVIVNTPNHLHFEHAMLALNAGKHVLIEKPFAATADEASQMFDLAKQNQCKIMAYQNRRWDSDFQSVRSIIGEGALGNLIEVHFRFDRYRNELSPKYFKEQSLPASGLSYDLGPHLLDQVISLFGKPLLFTKTSGTFREGSQVDDYLHVHLKYPENLNVFVTANLLVAHPLPSFVIHGTKGSYIKKRTDVQEEQLDKNISPIDPHYGIEPNGAEGMLVTVNNDGSSGTHYNTALKGNYNRLFDAIANHIQLDKPYPIKEEEIIWQLEILQ